MVALAERRNMIFGECIYGVICYSAVTEETLLEKRMD